MELISKGKIFKWQRTEIWANQASWKNYAVPKKRNIKVEYDLTERFRQPGFIIAPLNMGFPGVEFVCSWSREKVRPVVTFQCTWRNNHGVNLKAVCTLRRGHMQISDDQILEIHFVCRPGHEDLYATRTKESFLVGNLHRDLKMDSKTIVKKTELDKMWRNTKLFVIRPKHSWQRHLESYLSKY